MVLQTIFIEKINCKHVHPCKIHMHMRENYVTFIFVMDCYLYHALGPGN